MNLILFVTYHVIVVLMIIHILMDNRQPAKTVAWVLVIWFIPIAGIVLYLFFGTNQRKERMVSQRSMDQLTKRSMLQFVGQHNLQLPKQHRKLIDLFINESMALPFKDSHTSLSTYLKTTHWGSLSATLSSQKHDRAWRFVSSTTTWDAFVSATSSSSACAKRASKCCPSCPCDSRRSPAG